MPSLRSGRLLARLVLAWFVLFVGLSAAAPMVADGFDLVCTGTGGMKLVAVGGGDETPAAGGALDCPLCAAVVPPPAVVTLPMPQPLGYALQSIPSARIAALAAAPLPARGPPSSFA